MCLVCEMQQRVKELEERQELEGELSESNDQELICRRVWLETVYAARSTKTEQIVPMPYRIFLMSNGYPTTITSNEAIQNTYGFSAN